MISEIAAHDLQKAFCQMTIYTQKFARYTERGLDADPQTNMGLVIKRTSQKQSLPKGLLILPSRVKIFVQLVNSKEMFWETLKMFQLVLENQQTFIAPGPKVVFRPTLRVFIWPQS